MSRPTITMAIASREDARLGARPAGRANVAGVDDEIEIEWCAGFDGDEVERVHVAAFGGARAPADGTYWVDGVERYSLGWCTARRAGELIGFLNVLTDGHTHAWLQDVVVDPGAQHGGVGTAMVELAVARATADGCEWMHVDFDDDVADFYLRVCRFEPTAAGLRYLR